MQKKILAITGSKGLLGSNFCKKFKSRFKILKINYDLNDPKKIINYLKNKDIDVFLHLAAIGRSVSKNRVDFYKINYLATKYLAKYIKTKHFIFSSSSHVYKPSINIISEKSCTSPRNYYGVSKLLAEKEVIKFQKKYTILRIFNMYGNNQRKGYIIPDLKHKIKIKNYSLLDNVVRDFIHVNDAANAINFVIKNKTYGIFNICSGKQISLIDVVKKIEKKLSTSSNIKFKKTNDKIVGNNKKIIKKGFKFLKTFNKLNLNSK